MFSVPLKSLCNCHQEGAVWPETSRNVVYSILSMVLFRTYIQGIPPYVVTEPSVVPFPLSDKIKKMDTVVSERHWRAGCNACHGHVLESDIQPLCSCDCCCCKRRNASTCLTIRAVSQQVSLPTAAVVGGGRQRDLFRTRPHGGRRAVLRS